MRFGKITFLTLLTLGLLLSRAGIGGAQSWESLRTDHFTVFYAAGQEIEAWQALQSLEYYRPKLQAFFGNEQFHLPIVIDDGGTYFNGITDPLGFRIHFYKYSPGYWAGMDNWWAQLGVHEYTHELTISERSTCNFFGNLPMPNAFIPQWLAEGIAVYSESHITSYGGRLNDGVYDAYIAARVMDDKPPSLLDASNVPLEYPQQEAYYIYGSEFVNYLAKTYGAAKLAEFFRENGKRFWTVLPLPALGIDRSARIVFGKSFPELWREWWQVEREQYRDYRIDGVPLTHDGWVVSNPAIYANQLFFLRTYFIKTGAAKGFNFGKIVARDLATNRERVLVSNPGLNAFKIQAGKLYYALTETKPGYANKIDNSYGTYNALYRYDFKSGRRELVLADAYRDFTILANGQILYAKDRPTGFGSELYVADLSARQAHPKLLFDSDYLINEISAAGKRIVVSARKDWETVSLYELALDTHRFTPLVNTPYVEAGISVQDDRLFFMANYAKTYGIYCYAFNSGRVFRLTDGGYAAQPAYDPKSRNLYFVGLNSRGYNLYRKPAQFREYQLPNVPATVPPRFSLPESEVGRDGYADNLKTLKPFFGLPVVQYDDTHRITGVTLYGRDAIGDVPLYQASLGYDFKNQKTVADLAAQLSYWAPLQLMLHYRDWDGFNDRDLKLTAEYPLWGTRAAAGTALEYRGSFTTPFRVEPYLLLTSRHTAGEYLKVSVPLSATGCGLDTELFHRQYLSGSELDLRLKTYDEPENPELTLDKIRGYNSGLNSRTGMVCSLEYSVPVLRIHRGWWNPSIYFEDLTAVLFADQAAAGSGEKQSSFGLELQIDGKTLVGLYPFQLTGRYARNNENQGQYELAVQLPVAF